MASESTNMHRPRAYCSECGDEWPCTAVQSQHYLVSWVEGHRSGSGQCACGASIQTQGYESADQNLNALFEIHEVAERITKGVPDAASD